MRFQEQVLTSASLYKWLVTVAVMLGALSMSLNATTINVAIPDIMGEFGIPQTKAQWLSTGYLAAMAAFMLVNSWVMARFGMRRTFVVSILIFLFSAMVGGVGGDENALILARVVQGAMAGIMQPLAMTAIFLVFPSHQRGLGMGIFGLGVVMGPAFGPVLGGMLVDAFGWRALFYLPVPLCFLALSVGMPLLFGRDEKEKVPSFDFLGFFLLCGVIVGFLWVLGNVNRLGWDGWAVPVVAVAASMLAGFFWFSQIKSNSPLLNLRLLSVPGFAAGCIVAWCFGAILFGSTYLIPLFAQEIQGLDATAAGLLLMPAGLAMAICFPLAGALTDRAPPQALILFGLLLIVGSSYFLSLADGNTAFSVLGGAVALGRIGLGFCMPAINAGALQTIEMRDVSRGAGTVSFFRQLGASFGVGMLSVFIERRAYYHGEAFAGLQDYGRAKTQYWLMRVEKNLQVSGLSADEVRGVSLQYLSDIIYVTGYGRAFQDGYVLLGIGAMVAIVPVLIMWIYAGRRN